MDNTYDEVNHVDLDSIINKSGLKMLRININGLLGKLDFVKIIAERTKFDVLSVNETKIDEDIDDEDISCKDTKYSERTEISVEGVSSFMYQKHWNHSKWMS